jgi:hypothetical protein
VPVGEVADDPRLEDGRLQPGRPDQDVWLAHTRRHLVRGLETVLERHDRAPGRQHLLRRRQRFVQVVGLDREQHQLGVAQLGRVVRRGGLHREAAESGAGDLQPAGPDGAQVLAARQEADLVAGPGQHPAVETADRARTDHTDSHGRPV